MHYLSFCLRFLGLSGTLCGVVVQSNVILTAFVQSALRKTSYFLLAVAARDTTLAQCTQSLSAIPSRTRISSTISIQGIFQDPNSTKLMLPLWTISNKLHMLNICNKVGVTLFDFDANKGTFLIMPCSTFCTPSARGSHIEVK